jgi:hypothetical protein
MKISTFIYAFLMLGIENFIYFIPIHSFVVLILVLAAIKISYLLELEPGKIRIYDHYSKFDYQGNLLVLLQ